jgi:glycosyltransferase involved in cell wall biosynthesis
VTAPISVLIITRDEERNLPWALRSVAAWASEIVVVDMHSEDRTREIAEAAGARVLLHEPVGYVEPARSWAIGQCREEWVLLLDADEMVPAPLARRLARIAADDAADAVELPRTNYLLGRPMGHTGWGPHQDPQLRFFKRARVRFGDRIHGKPAPLPGVRLLRVACAGDATLVHFNYVDLEHFLAKLNRYTSVEAREARARGERYGVLAAVGGGVRRFLGRYVKQSGWRDGWRGFVLSAYQGFYEFARVTKRIEAERAGTGAEIEGRYRDVAERILREYEAAGGTGTPSGASAASRIDSARPSSSQST